MTDSKKPVEAATAAPGEKRAVSRPLAKASESGDPAVQKLLGDRQTAYRPGAAGGGAQVDAARGELGFE